MADQQSNDSPNSPNSKEVKEATDEFVDFLKDSKSKKQLQDFLIDMYKDFEARRVAEMKARYENEKKTSHSHPHHTTANISPLLSETMNMNEAEKAFVRSIQATKASLVKTLEDRVEETNRLLAGLGGYSSQLKSCFARSTVVFLEQEDPKFFFRERLIFSINLPNYELKRSWDFKANKKKGTQRRSKKAPMDPNADPRTALQATWDDAVNSLAQIIATTGLKPKYAKNDRHYGRFVMKQDLRSSSALPDEYFSFTLDYNTSERIEEMCVPYNKIVKNYDLLVKKLTKKCSRYAENSTSARFLSLKKKLAQVCQERDFFVGTTPDPNQLDEGLLFLIEVSTLRDYHVVKDRMQSIMTKYILHLSKLATKEAENDADLEYELWRMKNEKQVNKANAGQYIDTDTKAGSTPSGEGEDGIQEYLIDESALKPIKKKAA
jgi:hypothetical protein